MTLNIREGEYYYREARTLKEKQSYLNFCVFKCVGFNKKGTPKTEQVASFGYEEDADLFCRMQNSHTFYKTNFSISNNENKEGSGE